VVKPSQFNEINKSTKKVDKYNAKVLAEFPEKAILPKVGMKDDLQVKKVTAIP